MSQELIAILEQMGREKGIKKEILVEAVESALLSAARKVIDVAQEDQLQVQLDGVTGKVKVFKNGKEVDSVDFGRIAASTARQVIIQKIREAEKEIVFTEFNAKIGEIVSGTVYRFDKGNIIVDLLGKAEGILLKREQSGKEEFRQGQRIRAYILEVRKEPKGAQIFLSRAHPNFVKKLFELEVPEIYEGIVEIKAVARQAGERTKIAVCSKNEKVDSVGACVGMRGNRVKNIINEVQGERVEIVPFNEDIKEYIRAALSPAQVSEIKLDKQQQRAQVIVDDDQLSLCIGKHGQNVRLASRLVGWEFDVRSKTQIAESLFTKPKVEPVQQQPAAVSEEKSPLGQLEGVGDKTLAILAENGFKTILDLAKAKAEDLTKLKGIGEKKAEKLIEQAKKLSKK
ncbi:MAG: transcription termination factor NusA [Candidatus Omnitrophica bacterium]|nr:transcription termination factor NusA [Candidatus Omnitrophota bacterium]